MITGSHVVCLAAAEQFVADKLRFDDALEGVSWMV